MARKARYHCLGLNCASQPEDAMMLRCRNRKAIDRDSWLPVQRACCAQRVWRCRAGTASRADLLQSTSPGLMRPRWLISRRRANEGAGITGHASSVSESKLLPIVVRANKRQYAVTQEPVPRPCKRFSNRPCLNERFLKHLPACAACRAVVLFLDHQSDIGTRA